MNKKIQCPNCKSFNTYEGKYILLSVGVILTLIGLLVWPLLIVSVPVTMIGAIKAMFSNSDKMHCRNCKNTFLK